MMRYNGCFGRPKDVSVIKAVLEGLIKKAKPKLVLPLEREHRNARRKENDCEMYEGVREVMSKHGAETSCFYVQP